MEAAGASDASDTRNMPYQLAGAAALHGIGLPERWIAECSNCCWAAIYCIKKTSIGTGIMTSMAAPYHRAGHDL